MCLLYRTAVPLGPLFKSKASKIHYLARKEGVKEGRREKKEEEKEKGKK